MNTAVLVYVRHFQQYTNSVVAVSFIGGGNNSHYGFHSFPVVD